MPWLVAAACLALAVGAWWPRPRPELLQARIQAPPAPTVTIGAAEARQALLRDAPDAVTVPWSATPDVAAKSASGDVVWSNAQQKGYMRFAGLAANDPKQAQYQLWIFDEAQDKRFPVDGGVFDVDPATGEAVVAIDPKLAVRKPTLFAVTVERPGGVVVSKRERIVLTATPG
ncbi:MAG: anti-sigma factor [Polyangiaceae bacterium]